MNIIQTLSLLSGVPKGKIEFPTLDLPSQSARMEEFAHSIGLKYIWKPGTMLDPETIVAVIFRSGVPERAEFFFGTIREAVPILEKSVGIFVREME